MKIVMLFGGICLFVACYISRVLPQSFSETRQ